MSDSEAALEALLAEHGALLRRAIARSCPYELLSQRDDIEQEARLRLWQALERGTVFAQPASFVYRVAMTATLDAWRRFRSRGGEALPLATGEGSEETASVAMLAMRSESSPEDEAASSELGRKLRQALVRLSDNRRVAVELRLQGMTPLEVSRATGWSESSARKRIYRGLADLRARLREEGIEHADD